MNMPPALRKSLLILHVCISVGWMGAILVFLALSIIGLTSADAATVRGVYLVMEPAARFVLVPLAIASLVTGIVQSLGTKWGLLRHYWVIFKLVINLVATGVLLSYFPTFRRLAAVASDPAADLPDVRSGSPGLHSVLALIVLALAMALAVFKPRGLTARGWRKQQARQRRGVTA